MDDIQRKLALIDKQLSGGFTNSYQRIITTSPLLFAAVGLIVGILIQHSLFAAQVTSNELLFIRLWLIVLILAAAAVFLLFSLSAGRYTLYANLALICFACLGAIRLTSYRHLGPDDISRFVTQQRTLATIRGDIITEPYTAQNQQWLFSKFTYTDPASSFYLKLRQVKTTAGWAEVSGTVRVQVSEPVLDLKTGDYIQAYCWLDRFKPPVNPGQFNTAEYLARRNVYIAADVESRSSMELLEKSPTAAGSFGKIRIKLRQTATEALLDSPYPQDQSQSLLGALVLGYRSDIDSKTISAFRKTGLLHFVCLSGMNFGIVIGIVWWLCKTAGLMKRTRSVICIIAAVLFLMVVPPNAPALRAGIVSFVFCASFFFERRSNPLNSLSLAAIILLLINPTELFEASWQLSFAAVVGILLLADRIDSFLYEKITGLYGGKTPKTNLLFRIIARPGPFILSAFSISLSA